ncbi:aldo/keto reductase [Oceanibium sediminis]|uniref:aldo/keto reductase n=1 Tax=Oceanibium sediminis TaxID=2026339 RepID=UPI000DD2F015|nr:aldo/keto reductase [Oceanibium sediminis]
MTRQPESATLGRDVPIRRLITGLWQMADQERDGKPFDLDAAAEALLAYARTGFDTFDMADHYGSAEIVAGMVRKAMREAGETPPTILTKWCPEPGSMGASVVRKGIETALERLDLDCIDVMQFHWWRYESPEYLDALEQMMRLREEGLIREIGLTNFDAQHLRMLLKNGIEVASNQVCFSLLDRRAAADLSDVALAHDVAILAFGTLGGGFLSDRWIGAEEPRDIPDWSRMKYKRFIDAGGGWGPFQDMMQAVSAIAAKHGVSASNVASAWVLDHPAVRATIIGARLGETEHRADNLRALSLTLDAEDRAALGAATAGMTPIPGDCGDEYRKPPFLTASGDLSHHLDALPPVFDVAEVPSRPGRMRAESGSVWEAKAGFARAIRSGARILVSGTTATTPGGAPVCPGDVEGQAVYAFDKILAAILSLGGTPEDVIRTRIYLRRTEDWEAVSGVHARYFGATRPANTLVGGVDLIGPYDVEIEVEAEISGG